MRSFRPVRLAMLLLVLTAAAGRAQDAPAAAKPPTYIFSHAYHVLPGTHNNESGYFSLCEGLDGDLYIGTAKYGENAYLVEFDPRTGQQRIVIDTNKLCGVNGKGYAAQAKIHTRNFVGPSGQIYIGSKQGYAKEGDTSKYPGGYVMSYDPRTVRGTNLGMPMEGQGVIDVSADETRGLLYAVTCEEQHWMIGELKGGKYRDLGQRLTPYATTLIASDGRASTLTNDFQLAQYDPTTQKVTVRPIDVGGKAWSRPDAQSVPTWVLAPDQRHAYLILMNDPTLLEIDLMSEGPSVSSTNHGKMIEGKNPDSRCALSVSPDGGVYALVRIDNDPGFGGGYVNHLLRFDPKAKAVKDLGVLAIENPEFVNLVGADGKPVPFSNGGAKLPDGTMIPVYMMSLMVAHDGSVYVTTISPFTLHRITPEKLAGAGAPATTQPAQSSAAGRYIQAALQTCDHSEQNIEQITKLADRIAERHLGGGMIGFPFFPDGFSRELWGRSGGIVHLGFERPFKENRSQAEKANDVGLVAYDRAPTGKDLDVLKTFHDQGGYLIGFGPRSMPELKDRMAACDAWIDSGITGDGRVVDFGNGTRAGHANVLANTINGWTFVAELVSALTRRGHMPTMWKSYSYEDGRDWGARYQGKKQFHDDYSIAPIVAGELGRQFLRQIRYPMHRLELQVDVLQNAAQMIEKETAAGRKTFVAWSGHMPGAYIGQLDDAGWAKAVEFLPAVPKGVPTFDLRLPENSLVLRLGYNGRDPKEADALLRHHERVIELTGDHDDPAWQPTGSDIVLRGSLGYAFGDACVSIENYPIRLFAPSGIAQLVAYAAIDAQVKADSVAAR